MGCSGSKSQADSTEPAKIGLANRVKICTICSSIASLNQLLDCYCWVCRPCVVKELENLIAHNKTGPLGFSCPNCKRKAKISKD